MTGRDIARDTDGDDRYKFYGNGKAEIFDAAGEDKLAFMDRGIAGLSAVQVGSDLWVASAATVAQALASGVALSPKTVSQGAWIHDHATTGRIETVMTTDGQFSIDTLLI